MKPKIYIASKQWDGNLVGYYLRLDGEQYKNYIGVPVWIHRDLDYRRAMAQMRHARHVLRSLAK